MSECEKQCSVEGCGRISARRGMCGKHYVSWYRAQKSAGVTLSSRKHQIVLDCNPEYWTDEKAWLCGAIFGDGSVLAHRVITSNGNSRTPSVSFVSGDREFVEKVRNLISTSLPISGTESKFEFKIGSVDVAKYFNLVLGISGKKRPDTPYPKIPKRFKASFLRGLWDTDGHVSHDRSFLALIMQDVIKGVAADLWSELRLEEGRDFTVSEMPSTHHPRLRIRMNNAKSNRMLLDYLYLDSGEHIRNERKYSEYRSALVIGSSNPSVSTSGTCLVCGSSDVFARSLCRQHYSSTAWKSKFGIDFHEFKSAYDGLKLREIDWALKSVVISFLSARSDMQASPADEFDVCGAPSDNPRDAIRSMRKTVHRVRHVSWLSFSVPYNYMLREFPGPGKVFDPFAGWGTRMLAASRLGLGYEAFDVNSQLTRELGMVISGLGLAAKVHNRSAGVRENFSDIGQFEYSFTSPPYWTKEIYSEDPGQAQYYPSYRDWMLNCIYPCFEEVLKRMKKRGAIMVKNVLVNGVIYYMAEDLRTFLESAGCRPRVISAQGRSFGTRSNGEIEVLIEYGPAASEPSVFNTTERLANEAEISESMKEASKGIGLGRPRSNEPCKVCGSQDIHEMSLCKRHYHRYHYMRSHHQVSSIDEFVSGVKAGTISERAATGVASSLGQKHISLRPQGYVVRVNNDGKRVTVGTFKSLPEAMKARDAYLSIHKHRD